MSFNDYENDFDFDDSFEMFKTILKESIEQSGHETSVIADKENSITLMFNDRKRVKVRVNNDDEEQPLYISTYYQEKENIIKLFGQYADTNPFTITEETIKFAHTENN